MKPSFTSKEYFGYLLVVIFFWKGGSREYLMTGVIVEPNLVETYRNLPILCVKCSAEIHPTKSDLKRQNFYIKGILAATPKATPSPSNKGLIRPY